MAEPRRKIPPIPIEILAFHPAVMAMSCAPYGMLLRLVVHYWTTELRPLPSTDSALASIARAHRPTWSEHKAEIKKVLEEVMPFFERRYAQWLTRRSVINDQAIKGGKASAARRRERERAQTEQDLAPLSVVASQASTERRQATGKQRASGTYRE